MRTILYFFSFMLIIAGCSCNKPSIDDIHPPNNGDKTAPSMPTGVTVNVISGTQVNISWNASTDNIGVSGYRILKNDIEIGTTSATSLADGVCQPGNTYVYKVIAYDAAGNKSDPASVTATTPSAPTVTTGTITAITNTSLTFSGNVTSDGGSPIVARGFIITWNHEVNGTGSDSVAVSGTTGTFSFTKSNCTPGLKYKVKTFAKTNIGTSYGISDSATCTGYHIGQDLDYMIIFHTSADGNHYWAASKKDTVSGAGVYGWSWDNRNSNDRPFIVTSATSTTDGKGNTTLIVNALGNNPSAAKSCYLYTAEGKVQTGTFYLPAVQELKWLWEQKNLFPDHIGTSLGHSYHSSTEYNDRMCYYVYWGNGSIDTVFKIEANGTWPITYK